MDDDNEDATNAFVAEASRVVDLQFEPVPVLPGEDITSLIKLTEGDAKIGQGLRVDQSGSVLFTTVAGVLRYRAPASYWVDNGSKIYIPKTGDQVVGIVEDRGGDFYKINIFSAASTAILNKLSFEGATKRNKPELKRGDVVYARISLADKDVDTELTCLSSSGVKKEWSSGEAVSDNARVAKLTISRLTSR
jgi:exosome complex component RRP40